ncbi:PEGA domain-containing protein [Archangium sp.]|jgi:hypothetical protein|uniref:PEGA domain-containing protein n=1 Tax=Archangium sp. TaxID=1872627 RepID=UPI002EDBA8CB
MNKAPSGIAMTWVLLTLWVTPADAQRLQQGLESSGPAPWARGTSRKDQQAAYELFKAGNALLKESILTKAVEKYRQALQHWNHPAIHYNLALALIPLDQPVETHEHLVEAIRHGPESLEAGLFEHASNYKALVEKQLVHLTLTCDEPGTTVTLDGDPLFTGPGRYERLIRPGLHSIIARKEGYPTLDKSRHLTSGEQVKLQLKMYPFEYRRRWAAWMPWTVLGAGLAVGAGGGWMHLQTRKDYLSFDNGIETCGVSGCRPAPRLAATRTRGDRLQLAAFGSYALGGTALVTGAVLLYLNQPRPYSGDPAQGEETVNVTPLLGGDTTGVLATFPF